MNIRIQGLGTYAHLTSQSQKRVNAGAVNLLGLDRFENRAARLMGVRAVIEAASAGGIDYLGKRSSKTAFMTNQGQAAQTRGIRYNAARIRKRHHNCLLYTSDAADD